jgi:hypothetical protein
MLDDYLGGYSFTNYELRGVCETAEIWVQTDLSWLEGDPRAAPVVTDEQVAYMLGELENNIIPTDSAYFGEPDYHDGTNSLLETWGYVPEGYYAEATGKTMMLVSNVRDENYYDPTYPYYIAGFYSPTFEAYFDRNIITIDSYAWDLRVGPGSSQVYEGVTAHEFQHLIHDDYNTFDDTFMNEGCSMYAEVLCGYPVGWSDIDSFLYTPDNSLTLWGDQGGINILADYGQALMWTVYLSDHYGGADFISYFVKSGVPGIGGLNAAFAHFGYDVTFDEVFLDWRLANLLHTDQIGGGLYDYATFDLDETDQAMVHEISVSKFASFAGSDFGTTATILGYDTGVTLLEQYGTDYIKLTDLHKGGWPIFIFDGDDSAPEPSWVLDDVDGDGDMEWYSTPAGPEADIQLHLDVDLTGETEAVLSLDALWDIEDYWDFAFVQVSADGGETWTSLENEFTTYDHDPDAYPAIIDNLPGITEWIGGVWVNMAFDLSDYAGQSVIVNFRYMTDWGTEYSGIWVDNIMINDVLVDNADDIIAARPPTPPETDFLVTLVTAKYHGGSYKYTMVKDVYLNDLYEVGLALLGTFGKKDFVYVLVSPELGPVDYAAHVISLGGKCR